MVNVKNAIESLYIGRCTVTEHRQYIDSLSKQTHFEDVDIFSNIPCRLSFSSSRPTDENVAAGVTQSIKLFLAPEINIPAGCKITVTQNGKTTAYKQSGEPAVHTHHQEISLELFKKWA